MKPARCAACGGSPWLDEQTEEWRCLACGRVLAEADHPATRLDLSTQEWAALRVPRQRGRPPGAPKHERLPAPVRVPLRERVVALAATGVSRNQIVALLGVSRGSVDHALSPHNGGVPRTILKEAELC